LTARSYEELINANRRVLAGEFPELLVGGKQVQPGVWVARNVSVHPTAKLSPPAFLGENSRVGAMVQVGPSVSIGKDCVIERETFVSDSVICGGSYIGQKLALRGVIVNRSHLVNTRWNAEIEDVDDLLLGSVFSIPFGSRVRHVFVRGGAMLALFLAIPILLALLMASVLKLVAALRRQLIVRTPTASESFRWKMFPLWSFGRIVKPAGALGWAKHFFYCFLPALPSIAAGRIGLLGQSPLTTVGVEQLTSFRRAIYLRSRSGILPLKELCDALGGDVASTPVADLRWWQALALVGRYARMVLSNILLGTPHPGKS
jgi:hypothetical protein